jgi:hypothetical protein
MDGLCAILGPDIYGGDERATLIARLGTPRIGSVV